MTISAAAPANLFSFTLLALLMSATPGQNMACILDTAMMSGARAAFSCLAGMAVIYLGYLVAAGFGLGLLARQYPILLELLQAIGAAYVFYLSWAIQAASLGGATGREGPVSGGGHFRKGLATNLTNPANLLLYVAIIPQFAGSDTQEAVRTTIIMGTIFVVLAMSANACAAVAGARLGPVIRARSSWVAFQRWLLSTVLALTGWMTISKLAG